MSLDLYCLLNMADVLRHLIIPHHNCLRKYYNRSPHLFPFKLPALYSGTVENTKGGLLSFCSWGKTVMQKSKIAFPTCCCHGNFRAHDKRQQEQQTRRAANTKQLFCCTQGVRVFNVTRRMVHATQN